MQAEDRRLPNCNNQTLFRIYKAIKPTGDYLPQYTVTQTNAVYFEGTEENWKRKFENGAEIQSEKKLGVKFKQIP